MRLRPNAPSQKRAPGVPRFRLRPTDGFFHVPACSKDGKNHLTKKDIACETDELTHVYTLIVKTDNSYEVRPGQATGFFRGLRAVAFRVLRALRCAVMRF